MTEPFSALKQVHKTDVPRVAALFTNAFSEDPLWKAIFGETGVTPAASEAAFEMPARYCLRYGSVFASSDAFEGAMAFVPGQWAKMTGWRTMLCGGMSVGFRMGFKLLRAMEPIFQALPADMEAHMHGRDYIYLQIIGVRQENQGQGIGGRMLRPLLSHADSLGVPVYLETETEANVRLYERFGFSVLKTATLPVVNLPMWEMAREPAAAQA